MIDWVLEMFLIQYLPSENIPPGAAHCCYKIFFSPGYLYNNCLPVLIFSFSQQDNSILSSIRPDYMVAVV
jgi:hypothetical protein